MSNDLAPLIARVEAATGPDRRLDLDICAALGTLEYGPTARGWTRHPHPELTASLDAALALVERCGIDVEGLMGDATSETYHWVEHVESYKQRLVLAALAALLRALQAQAQPAQCPVTARHSKTTVSPTLEKGKE